MLKLSDKQKKAANEALATINGALTILDRFPSLDDNGDFELSSGASLSPLSYLMMLFKSTKGYNYVIEIIARFIAYQLPIIEAAVKGILMSQLKDLLSCSVNPLISNDILENGIIFDVSEIDIADILKYSPFDKKIGHYFYFGTEGAQIADDLIRSNDMDAFIWFIINKSNRRYTWKPLANRNDKEFPNKDYEAKREKSDGIITLEYYENGLNCRNANGENINRQTPYNNTLHVFIGDVRENNGNQNVEKMITFEQNLNLENDKIKRLNNNISNQEYNKTQVEEQRNLLDDLLSSQKINKDEYASQYKSLTNKLNSINDKLNTYQNFLKKSTKTKQNLQLQIGQFDLKKIGKSIFDGIKNNRNYYYHKTLIEFNIDYIMSLKLFDEKVLAAKLLDALTGFLTIDLALSYRQQLIKSEVKKMVDMIVDSDDLVISDCFFTFTNEDYDALSREAELRKAGLLSINGNQTSAVKVDAESILSKLNQINENASKETIKTVIEGSLTEISKELSDTTYAVTDHINAGLQLSFIENLLNNLAYILISAVISPKVYLLLLINLKIAGRETNFNLEQFIGSYKQMLANIIRAIRDKLLEYLVSQLMAIVGELVEDIAVKFHVEQAQYYAKLLKKLLDCFKRSDSGFDFNLDDVDYADILTSDGEPANAEC